MGKGVLAGLRGIGERDNTHAVTQGCTQRHKAAADLFRLLVTCDCGKCVGSAPCPMCVVVLPALDSDPRGTSIRFRRPL